MMIPSKAPGRQCATGFTLLELLITLAIIGLLSLAAVPSYQEQIARSRRADAKAALQNAALWMERNQAATFRYDRAPDGATVDNTKLSSLGLGKTPAAGPTHYLIQFTANPSASNYTIKAVPQEGQAKADGKCGTLAIDHIGQRGRLGSGGVVVDAESEACWQR